MSIQKHRKSVPLLPRATSVLSVARADGEMEPKYLGQVDDEVPPLKARHYISLRNGFIVEGTLEDLREIAAKIGEIAANVEFDVLTEDVRRGNRIAASRHRRLA